MIKISRKFLVVILSITLGIFYFLPVFAAPTSTINAGFVNGLWFSKTPFFDGDNVRIYTAVQNQSPYDIIGKINFFDSNNIIGSVDFSATTGQLAQKWVDWRAVGGNHSLYATVSNVKKTLPGSEPEDVEIGFFTLPAVSQFIDIDTDKDGLGNLVDPDDDNDGLSDEREKDLHTDPLLVDSDKDGINDDEEVRKGLDPIVFNIAPASELDKIIINKKTEFDFKNITVPSGGQKVVQEIAQRLETVTGLASSKSGGLINKLTDRLEDTRSSIINSAPLDEKPLSFVSVPVTELTKSLPFLKISSSTLPTLTDLRVWLLELLIIILGNKWLLSIVCILWLWALIKAIRAFFN